MNRSSTKKTRKTASSSKKRVLQSKLVPTHSMVIVLIVLVAGYYYYGLKSAKTPRYEMSINPAISQTEQEKIDLSSPVDSKKLEYNNRMTTGLYLGGIPVDIFYEELEGEAPGRFVVYHAWNAMTDQNYGGFVITEEKSGPCLNQLLPTTKSDGMRYVTDYICGDTQQIKVTSFSFKPEQDITKVQVENLATFDLLNEHFSSVYKKSFVKVIGWQDFNHLIVDQITYSEEQLGAPIKEQHELYLFDVTNGSKTLVHTRD